MRPRASSAVSSSMAATAATGSPTKRTLSSASACSSWLTGRMPNGIGSSAPTRVASTPGCAAARETSIFWILACGCGERSSLPKHIRGSTRSSAKTVWPVTLAAASTFGSDRPMTDSLRWSGTRRLRRRAHALSSQLDGFEYLQVAGAAAEVAAQGLGDPLPARVGISPKQCLGHQQDAGDAVAALRRAQLRKCLLQGMQRGAGGEALHRRHLAAFALHRQGQTGKHGPTVEQNRAGPALPQLATVLGAHEAQLLAEHLEQRVMHGREGLPLLAVHPQPDAEFS